MHLRKLLCFSAHAHMISSKFYASSVSFCAVPHQEILVLHLDSDQKHRPRPALLITREVEMLKLLERIPPAQLPLRAHCFFPSTYTLTLYPRNPSHRKVLCTNLKRSCPRRTHCSCGEENGTRRTGVLALISPISGTAKKENNDLMTAVQLSNTDV